MEQEKREFLHEKKFYPRSLFVHQNGCRFILMVNQYGRRDVRCKTRELKIETLGTLSVNDGDGYENVTLKVIMKWRCFTLSRLFYLVQFVKCWQFFSGVQSVLKDCTEVQEKKEKVVILRTRPPQNVKIGIFTS